MKPHSSNSKVFIQRQLLQWLFFSNTPCICFFQGVGVSYGGDNYFNESTWHASSFLNLPGEFRQTSDSFKAAVLLTTPAIIVVAWLHAQQREVGESSPTWSPLDYLLLHTWKLILNVICKMPSLTLRYARSVPKNLKLKTACYVSNISLLFVRLQHIFYAMSTFSQTNQYNMNSFSQFSKFHYYYYYKGIYHEYDIFIMSKKNRKREIGTEFFLISLHSNS